MNANTTHIKERSPYKDADVKSQRSGKHHPGKIRVWRFDDPSTEWLKRDQERHK
jgi:hypothetical protein